MSKEALRAEVCAAVTIEYQRVGPAGFRPRPIVTRFTGRGAPDKTLYRWISAHIAREGLGPKFAAKMARRAKAAVAKEAERRGTTQVQAMMAVADRALPVVPSTGFGPGTRTVDLLEGLKACVAAGQQVMTYARNFDGSVKMAKTLIAGSEHVRRSVESLAKIRDSLANAARIEEFHDQIIGVLEDVATEYPELGPIVLARLRNAIAAWRA